MVKIRFLRSGCNTSFGSFSPDDEALVSPELAEHFIGLGCAESMEFADTQPAVEPEEKPAEVAPKRKRA